MLWAKVMQSLAALAVRIARPKKCGHLPRVSIKGLRLLQRCIYIETYMSDRHAFSKDHAMLHTKTMQLEPWKPSALRNLSAVDMHQTRNQPTSWHCG